MFGKELYQESLTQIIHVFLGCHVGYAEQLCQVVVFHLLANVVYEMVGCFPQGVGIADVETPLDVLAYNGFQQALHISTLVAYVLYFRESTCHDVVHESPLPFCLSLGGDTGGVNPVICAVFIKGEGEEAYFVVAACKMRGKFAT